MCFIAACIIFTVESLTKCKIFMVESLTKCCKKVEEELAGRPMPTSKEVREERAAISRAHMARYAPGPGYVWNPDTGLFEHELSPPSSPPYHPGPGYVWNDQTGQFDKELPPPSSPPSPPAWCSTPPPPRTPTFFRYRLPGGGSFTKPAGDASNISR